MLTVLIVAVGIFVRVMFPLFLLTALFSLTSGLIYDAFYRKELVVHAGFVIGHFILMLGSLYISFFCLRIYMELGRQVITKGPTDYNAIDDLKKYMMINVSFVVVSGVLFIVGLYKSHNPNKPQLTDDSVLDL
mgnify:CR=1 FL=1